MHKLITLILLSSFLQAATYDNKLELGLKTTSYNYTERDGQDNLLDTEDSDFLGINGIYGSYDYKLSEEITEDSEVAYYLNVYTSISFGDTDYTGSLLNSPAGYGSYTSTTANEFYEFQVNLKRLRQYDKSATYTMIGLGYKEWARELSDIQLETYYYFFLQAVIGAEKEIYKDWKLGLDLSVQLGINPKMDAEFSETPDTYALNETFDLGTVYTYKIATPLTIPLNKELSFTTKLEYEFTNYGQSDTITTNFEKAAPSSNLYEPKSQQKNWHLYAGFQFIF